MISDAPTDLDDADFEFEAASARYIRLQLAATGAITDPDLLDHAALMLATCLTAAMFARSEATLRQLVTSGALRLH